jgi:hypothetical protein
MWYGGKLNSGSQYLEFTAFNSEYAKKEVFSQHSITSHLVAVFWRRGGMASSFINSSIGYDEI